MEIDLFKLLNENLVLLTFVVIGIGYILAKIKIAGIPIGTTAGVLLAGMLFGHFGLHDQPAVATFGFTLFIFAVGLQAGPSFFSAFISDGPKYIAMAVLVGSCGVLLAYGVSRVLGLETGLGAGMLAGALTSTPTLIGAQDAVRSGMANIPEGMTARDLTENISVGYALTYVFRTVGPIVFIRYMPSIFKLDLPAEARKFASERGLEGRGRGRRRPLEESLPIIRAYHLREDFVGMTVEQAIAAASGKLAVLKIRRGEALLDPERDLELKQGDVVCVIASLRQHREREGFGEEVLDPELLQYRVATEEIVLTQPHVTGKPLGELDFVNRHGCYVTDVIRASVHLRPDDSTVLQKGDRLVVSGEESRLQNLSEEIGYIDADIEETDLMTFSFGIAFGVMLGLIMVKIMGVSISIGSAGGLLLGGILIGFLRSLHPTFGQVPAAARYILRELGLMLFMSTVGLKAGAGIVEAITTVGPAMILCGILVTLGPVLIGWAFGRYVLRMNPALLLGSITGAMTSTPALSVVTDAAKSNVPSLGYAGTYTFANVLLTFAGTVMMLI
jgi:putative transport protein